MKCAQQRSIHPVWSKSSLCFQWVAKNPRFLHTNCKDSDQTGLMPRLIWVFAGRTGYFVGFVMLRLIFFLFSPKTMIPAPVLRPNCFHMSHDMTKPTKWHVRPAKTQINLDIRPVWSESSLSAWRNLGSLATHWAHSEDSDQTGRMPRLIWVFAVRTLILLVLSCRSSNDFSEWETVVICTTGR